MSIGSTSTTIETRALRTIRECRHGQLLVGKGNIDEPLGIILKRDLLNQVLDGQALDPVAVIRQPLVVHEAMRIFKVLEQFKKAPVRLATIVNEYGGLEGIVTQTDLLEAIAGDLADVEGEEPDVVEREDGSLLIDGMMSAQDAFDQLDSRHGLPRAASTPLPASSSVSSGICPRSESILTTKAGDSKSSIWMGAASTRCWRSRLECRRRPLVKDCACLRLRTRIATRSCRRSCRTHRERPCSPLGAAWVASRISCRPVGRSPLPLRRSPWLSLIAFPIVVSFSKLPQSGFG